jgi:dUTP pyrophosphatase
MIKNEYQSKLDEEAVSNYIIQLQKLRENYSKKQEENKKEIKIMNKFEKVSYSQYSNSIGGDVDLTQEYEDIKLPKRATKHSAGYDFYSPFSFTLEVGETIKIPTGIRVMLDDNKVLKCYPRSSLGFKYKVQLNNTVGIIDADYYYSDNEGHIFFKLTNDGTQSEGKVLSVNKGEAIVQGIIEQYFITVDDDTTDIRNGGFGSTNQK